MHYQHIEIFHLLFLEQLSQRLDKRLYALKGGCNIRFFLNSLRYSEDIDFDVQTIAIHTLKKTVNNILSSKTFNQILNIRKISILQYSSPKQTQTTQRWKVQLKINDNILPINTKIEFSRKDKITNSKIEPINNMLISKYNLKPLFITHYPNDEAMLQKIKALILRTETQARDVFDLYHLSNYTDINIHKYFSAEELQIAANNALGIKFSEFRAQVLSYLEIEKQQQFDDKDIWDNIVEKVIKILNI